MLQAVFTMPICCSPLWLLRSRTLNKNWTVILAAALSLSFVLAFCYLAPFFLSPPFLVLLSTFFLNTPFLHLRFRLLWLAFVTCTHRLTTFHINLSTCTCTLCTHLHSLTISRIVFIHTTLFICAIFTIFFLKTHPLLVLKSDVYTPAKNFSSIDTTSSFYLK